VLREKPKKDLNNKNDEEGGGVVSARRKEGKRLANRGGWRPKLAGRGAALGKGIPKNPHSMRKEGVWEKGRGGNF